MADPSPTEDSSPHRLNGGRIVALIGALSIAHAAVWLLLRVPEVPADPFVGAEGLAIGGLLLIAIGLGPMSELH